MKWRVIFNFILQLQKKSRLSKIYDISENTVNYLVFSKAIILIFFRKKIFQCYDFAVLKFSFCREQILYLCLRFFLFVWNALSVTVWMRSNSHHQTQVLIHQQLLHPQHIERRIEWHLFQLLRLLDEEIIVLRDHG